ncbi:hypothetical protein H6F73_09625 [Microcoleus sp. FACHB-68]|nr:hypothetical protein [Microcoleus sp. FACHB-68]
MFHRYFRRVIVATVFSLPIVSLIVPSAQAEDLNFTLKNETSGTLVEFYVEPSDQENWGSNLLQGQNIKAGESGMVMIGDGKTTCVYDILGVWADGSRTEDYKLNLCELGSYTYTE